MVLNSTRLSYIPMASIGIEMNLPMASMAKSDEVFFHITSQKAARQNMMNLKILRYSASLASPAIAFEHLSAKPLIRVPI